MKLCMRVHAVPGLLISLTALLIVAPTLNAQGPPTSASGKIVADSFNGSDIYIMNPDGSNVVRITPFPGRISGEPACSPDGRKIVFASPGPQLGPLVAYLMNPDGSQVTRVPNQTVPNVSSPHFSPDGHKILFAGTFFESTGQFFKGAPQIFVMDLDGSGLTRLTNPPGSNWDPAYSPDGMEIVFTRITEGQQIYHQLFIMHTDGANARSVTVLGNGSGRPTFSPDSRTIAFSTDGQIYLINADGSNLRRLTNPPAKGYTPTFSSDGRKIAFTSTDDQIYLIDPDGSHLMRLTNPPEKYGDPAFCP